MTDMSKAKRKKNLSVSRAANNTTYYNIIKTQPHTCHMLNLFKKRHQHQIPTKPFKKDIKLLLYFDKKNIAVSAYLQVSYVKP